MVTLKDGEALEELYDDRKIIQNSGLYRFTSDSILLAKFARYKKGDEVADFCSGSGIVGFYFLCSCHNMPRLTLFEMQESLADMSRRTALLNGFDCDINCCRVQDIGREYDGKFSLILCNPPYERGGFENEVYERAICRKEMTLTLPEIAEAASRALKFGGRIDIVNRADRVAELIYTLKSKNIETKRIQFVSGKTGAKPYLVLVEAVKGGKPGTEILPLIINDAKSGGSGV